MGKLAVKIDFKSSLSVKRAVLLIEMLKRTSTLRMQIENEKKMPQLLIQLTSIHGNNEMPIILPYHSIIVKRKPAIIHS